MFQPIAPRPRNLWQQILPVQAALILLGVLGWGAALGKLGVLSFAAGATVSVASFWILNRLAGVAAGKMPGPLSGFLIAVRLLAAGYVLYVILNTYAIDRTALLTGLLTPAASLLFHCLFYARSSS
jgi:hypothetical protein